MIDAVSEYPPSQPGGRRQACRAPANIELEFSVSGGATYFGVARDISVGGMFVAADHTPAIGSEVVIACVLFGGGARVRLPATVRWSRTDGFGVQFGLLGARETHALASLMTRLRSRSS